MKKIALNILLFLSLFLFLLFGCIWLVNDIIAKNASFELNPSTKYIVVGHSHPECAFNDSLISNFTNCSQSGESYFYTFFKTKKILEQNKNVKTVFIEFTNNQIDTVMNGWIWGNTFGGKNFYKYAPYMNFKDNLLLITNNLSGYSNNLAIALRTNSVIILQKDFKYSKIRTGGYQYMEKTRTDSLLSSQRGKHQEINNQHSDISVSNLEYLDKILQYCNDNKVKPYLVRSPLHDKYEGYSNEQKFRDVVTSKYSDFEFLDFSKFPLLNSDFYDLDHLNYKGAKIFSIWFNKLISKGLLEQPNKQQIIDMEMGKLRTETPLISK